MVSWSHDHRVSGARSKSTIVTEQLVLAGFRLSHKRVHARTEGHGQDWNPRASRKFDTISHERRPQHGKNIQS